MNQIVPFAQGTMPAHIAAFAAGDSNIGPKDTLPQLSTRGKVFRIVIDGQETPLTKVDKDTGETVPVNMVKVIILDYNKARSRAYYESGFDPDKKQAPACWSSDGKVPDESVPTKQAANCTICPRSQKGSKVTASGKPSTECAQNKRIAVIPASNLQCPALILRLAVTSIWDKDNAINEDKNYYAWDQYVDYLRQHGVAHTGLVVTNVKFDLRKEYPKLVFKAAEWVTPEMLAELAPRMGATATEENRALLAKLLSVPESTLATRAEGSVNASQAPAAPTPAPAPAKPAKAPKAAPAPVVDDDDEPVAAAPVDDDDEAVDVSLPPARAVKGNGTKAPAPLAAVPSKAGPKGTPAAVTPAASDQKGLAALLGQWSGPASDE
jgi:hypothetical protein